ncbi:hypothetical protein Hdeb2414_s0001g00002401 [Helianthus debilis subsp. tardiflorus]
MLSSSLRFSQFCDFRPKGLLLQGENQIPSSTKSGPWRKRFGGMSSTGSRSALALKCRISMVCWMKFTNTRVQRFGKKTIEVVLYASVWRVWKSRKGKVFENIPFSVLKVVEEIKEDSYFWLKHRSPFSKLDWMRWRDFNIRDIIM